MTACSVGRHSIAAETGVGYGNPTYLAVHRDRELLTVQPIVRRHRLHHS